jgi:hypothetical protein
MRGLMKFTVAMYPPNCSLRLTIRSGMSSRAPQYFRDTRQAVVTGTTAYIQYRGRRVSLYPYSVLSKTRKRLAQQDRLHNFLPIARRLQELRETRIVVAYSRHRLGTVGTVHVDPLGALGATPAALTAQHIARQLSPKAVARDGDGRSDFPVKSRKTPC